jgi:hypothetical protein
MIEVVYVCVCVCVCVRACVYVCIYMLLCYDCSKLHICQTGQTLKTQYTEQITYTHANNKHSAYAAHIHLTKLKNYGNECTCKKTKLENEYFYSWLDYTQYCRLPISVKTFGSFQSRTFIWVHWWSQNQNMYIFILR